MDNKNTMNTVVKVTKGNVAFINNNMSFSLNICLFYSVEKIERLGQRDALGDKGSYDGYISSFDVFYASSFDVVVTWWKYMEMFKK